MTILIAFHQNHYRTLATSLQLDAFNPVAIVRLSQTLFWEMYGN